MPTLTSHRHEPGAVDQLVPPVRKTDSRFYIWSRAAAVLALVVYAHVALAGSELVAGAGYAVFIVWLLYQMWHRQEEGMPRQDVYWYLKTRGPAAPAVVIFLYNASALISAAVLAATALWLLVQLRAQARRHLTDRAIKGMCAQLGHPSPHRSQIKPSRRWSGLWTGSPRKISIRYSPVVLDEDYAAPAAPPAVGAPGAPGDGAAPTPPPPPRPGSAVPRFPKQWIADIADTLHRRFGGHYSLVKFNQIEGWLQFALTPPPDPPPALPTVVVRAQQIVAEQLKMPEATVIPDYTTIEPETAADDDTDPRQLDAAAPTADVQMNAFDSFLPTGAMARLARPAVRAELEATLTALLGDGRWRVLPDLTHDHVRVERRRPLPHVIEHPPPDLTSSQLIGLGTDEDERRVGWDLGMSAHLAVSGETGKGKTVVLRGVVCEWTARGWPVWIADPKMVEFIGLRGWPNVQVVAATVPDQIAVIHRAWCEMNRRYEAWERGETSGVDFEPLLLVIDEFRVLWGRVSSWYAPRHQKGMPRTSQCPVFEWIGDILRLGRLARVHVALGTQRPDAYFFQGEHRDNVGARVSAGRLRQDGAKMMWESAYVGVSLPAIIGRSTMQDADGHPVEAQADWTPDPAGLGVRSPLSKADDLALLKRLWPAKTPHPPLDVRIPDPTDLDDIPDNVDPEWWSLICADLVPAPGRTPTELPEPLALPAAPTAAADHASAGFVVAADGTTIPMPGPRLGDQPEAGKPTEATATPAPADPPPNDRYGDPEQVWPAHLQPGDLVYVDEPGAGLWAAVEAAEPDPFDDGYVCIAWRGPADEAGVLERPGDQPLPARRHPAETLTAAA